MGIKLEKIKIYHIMLSIYLIAGISAMVLSVIYRFNRQQIGFAFIIGSFMSLLISQNFQITNTYKQEKENFHFFKSSIILWIYVALLSVILFLNSIQNYYLPLTYFISITSLSLIIASQILIPHKLTKFRINIILIEIIVLSMILSASFLFLFPGPYGNDSSFHIEFISNILKSGNIEYSNAGQYQVYPVYHILFAETILLPNLDIKIATFVLAFEQILFLLFIFLICNKLFNSKIALISTLLISISTNILVPRYYLFPGSFSVVFFIFFLYLFLANLSEFRSAFIVIILFTSNFIHPLLPFIIFLSLLVMFICFKILKLNFKIQTSLIFLSAILMVFQWTRPTGNGDYSIFSNFIGSIRFTFEEGSSVTQATMSPFYNWIDIFMYELGFTILILFGIGGALWFLKVGTYSMEICTNSLKEYNKGNRILAVMVTLVFIPIPYILAIVYPNSIPARWFIFIEVLAGIFAGASIFMIFEILSKYKLKFLMMTPIFILIFFSITSPTANPNSQLYAKELSRRNALFWSEISGAKFVNNDVDKENIHGNFAYLQYIDRKLSQSKNFINPNINKTYQTGIVLIRNDDIKKGFNIPLYGHQGKLFEIDKPISVEVFINDLNKIDKIYDNGEVRMYSNLN